MAPLEHQYPHLWLPHLTVMLVWSRKLTQWFRTELSAEDGRTISQDNRSPAFFPNMVFSLTFFLPPPQEFSALIMSVSLEEFTFGSLNALATANPFHKTHFWESLEINVYRLSRDKRSQWHLTWFKHCVSKSKKQVWESCSILVLESWPSSSESSLWQHM